MTTLPEIRVNGVKQQAPPKRRGRPPKVAAPTVIETTIELPQIDVRIMNLTVAGLSPLIIHRWSDKAKQMIKDKQAKKATKGREQRNPKKEYEESLYPFPGGGYGFPSVGFKAAAITAVGQISGLTKTFTRGTFHVNLGEDLVKIEGTPRMREDMVRLAMGVADIRYRAEFPEWTCVLKISYNATVISPEQIANLFNIAGYAVGVGEWRPERDGAYGMFHVV